VYSPAGGQAVASAIRELTTERLQVMLRPSRTEEQVPHRPAPANADALWTGANDMQALVLRFGESVPDVIVFLMVFVLFVASTTVTLLMLRASQVESELKHR